MDEREICVADYSYSNPENRIRARRLLRSVMDQAKQRSEQIDFDPDSASALFSTMAPHIAVERLDGLHIYKSAKSGWHADIAFKDMPPGITAIIGIPTSKRLSTTWRRGDPTLTSTPRPPRGSWRSTASGSTATRCRPTRRRAKEIASWQARRLVRDLDLAEARYRE